MKKKKVILLVVLISTLILIPTVIVIVSAGVLTAKQDNVLNSAKAAMFKEDVREFQDELADKVSRNHTDDQGKSNEKINATGKDVKKYIKL